MEQSRYYVPHDGSKEVRLFHDHLGSILLIYMHTYIFKSNYQCIDDISGRGTS